MRIGNSPGNAVQQQYLYHFPGRQHGAFKVHMGIHEPGGQVEALYIDFLPALILADPYNLAAADGYIRHFPCF